MKPFHGNSAIFFYIDGTAIFIQVLSSFTFTAFITDLVRVSLPFIDSKFSQSLMGAIPAVGQTYLKTLSCNNKGFKNMETV